MRDLSKKIELAKNPNSKVLICNTPEAKLLAELIPNVDKVYKYLRNNVGTKNVEIEYFNEKREDVVFIIKKLNSFVNEMAIDNNLKNVNEITIEEGK
ncbi:hypothetical protein [Poseidonibacter ostreae]|uniref:Uncharacterized protein n=2 Tax=Poseidonibacter ostreae TaxID=2654171 RepID=A0ABQ6VHA1_9BACT|nr:hypothetical protein [Poseidonibacter ostreae]KAB7881221.1 hypothetical protein GA417_14195 [Poseidonibacter ostreae]KAB7886348.1 hypothetical protein GBG18_14715 [Poseidonibacter ostreae]MAC84323.1 hypothetical protein [Arcobacter sp.]|tara:strand:- start:5348 stop:5638 length:291 start_codon:yes stop_codon:yes gene_type:complete